MFLQQRNTPKGLPGDKCQRLLRDQNLLGSCVGEKNLPCLTQLRVAAPKTKAAFSALLAGRMLFHSSYAGVFHSLSLASLGLWLQALTDSKPIQKM